MKKCIMTSKVHLRERLSVISDCLVLVSDVFYYVFSGDKTPMSSVFSQAYQQLSGIPSRRLCVRLAAGGDPTYAFNVRLTGEEVHGTSM